MDTMISERQRQTFADHGLIRLEVIPKTTVATLRERAFRTIERAGYWQHRAWVGDPLARLVACSFAVVWHVASSLAGCGGVPLVSQLRR